MVITKKKSLYKVALWWGFGEGKDGKPIAAGAEDKTASTETVRVAHTDSSLEKRL